MKTRRDFFYKINDIPLSYKFILIYVLCVLIPIVTINLVFFSKISALVKEREAENFRIAVERARTVIIGLIQGCVAVSHSISTDQLLYDLLGKEYSNSNDYYSVYNAYLRDRLNRFVPIYNHISELSIYTTNATISSGGNYYYIDNEVKRKSWYGAITQSKDPIILFAYQERIPNVVTTNDQYLCLIRKMNEFERSNKVENFVKINIDINKLYEIFSREQNYINICLIDGENRLIYAPQNQFFYHYRRKIQDSRLPDFGEDSIVLVDKLGEARYLNGWRIIGIAEKKTIMKALSQSNYFILPLTLLCMMVSTLLIVIIVRSYNYRLKRLSRHMLKVKDGQFELIKMNEGKDEIGGLIRSFNLMTVKIRSLINDVYKLEIQKKDLELERVRAELNFLQSQMNPHFLFNTLNAILVVCVKNNYHEVVEVIKYLSKTLRRLLSWQDDLVTITEELSFSEMYLKIEKFRFGEKFRYEMQIDEAAREYMIPKMTIQPLIENACKHGIQTIKGTGMIKVKVELTPGAIKVAVTDNGSGIESDKLVEIVRHIGERLDSGGNIGLRNVYRRLKLYYGDAVQFNILSGTDSGTEVNFTIPLASLLPSGNEKEAYPTFDA